MIKHLYETFKLFINLKQSLLLDSILHIGKIYFVKFDIGQIDRLWFYFVLLDIRMGSFGIDMFNYLYCLLIFICISCYHSIFTLLPMFGVYGYQNEKV